jgi:hypothetical protein
LKTLAFFAMRTCGSSHDYIRLIAILSPWIYAIKKIIFLLLTKQDRFYYLPYLTEQCEISAFTLSFIVRAELLEVWFALRQAQGERLNTVNFHCSSGVYQAEDACAWVMRTPGESFCVDGETDAVICASWQI